nr:serine hydrolase [Pedobacter jejuensis]
MIKVPITCGIFNKIEQGELDYHSELMYCDSLLYAGEDILGSFKDSEKIALSKDLMLMITTSDNTASLWSQLLAGTGTAINAVMDSNGLKIQGLILAHLAEANTRKNTVGAKQRLKKWQLY